MPTTLHASVKQLARKIASDKLHARFSFFLGAGASRQSGVITASEMIRIFKDGIVSDSAETFSTEEEKDKWLTEQDWYKTPGKDYCKLFEQFEPKEIGRQRYIESIIEGREPSFGYVVLANLMASKLINTIVTTNFDDLVYSACTSYTGIRPIVYAYGVLASEMRLTAQRPKILKLHGDYLYSTLKNTGRDLEFQDPNMARQLAQVLNEYGLIVVGYGGEDDSVMKILGEISPKNDLYWCVLRGTEPVRSVTELLEEKGGFLVEIDGFDQLMNEIRRVVGFDVGKMLGSIQERQEKMIEKVKTFDPQYSSEILSEIVEALQKQGKEEEQRLVKIKALDLFTKGLKAADQRNIGPAEKFFREVLDLTPMDVNAQNNLGVALLRAGKYREAEVCFFKATELNPQLPAGFYNLGLVQHRGLGKLEEAEVALRRAFELDPKATPKLNDFVQILRVRGKLDEALTVGERGLELQPQNPALLLSLVAIKRALNDAEGAQRYAELARPLIAPEDWYNRACLESVSGNTDQALTYLAKAAQETEFNVLWVNSDPDLAEIRSDSRYRAILNSVAKKN